MEALCPGQFLVLVWEGDYVCLRSAPDTVDVSEEKSKAFSHNKKTVKMSTI